MHYPWLKTPLFRVFCPFLIGILLAIFANEPFSVTQPYTIACVILILVGVSRWLSLKWLKLYWLPTLLIVILFLGIGWQRVNQTYTLNHPDHFSNHSLRDSSSLLLKIQQPPVPKDETVQVKAEVIGLAHDEEKRNASIGKALVYIEKDSLSTLLAYGDVLIAANKFERPNPPPNPKQFNHKAFLANKQIYHQAFLNPQDWQLSGMNQGWDLFRGVYQTREQLLEWLRSSLTRADEIAVASALLTGYKESIDPELRQSYASTGAMHVLAVSGLHVGIIYLMLSAALSFLNPIPKGNYIKMAIIILALWLYACLTGLPPSVIRAATMFSFVAIGSNLKRLTNIYGSILTSMFVLLFINPYLLTQVGFQLSYAAVLGIVFLQPKIYHLIDVSGNWLLDQIWAITAVSFAAQLATFPLTLFYFNQFPTYFLVSNLVVIPAAFLIVPAGFIFFILKGLPWNWIDPISEGMGFLLDHMLFFLNYLIESVQALPYSLINEVFITTGEFWLIYLALIGFVLGITLRAKGWLFMGMGAGLGLAILLNINYWQSLKLDKLAALEVDNRTVIARLTPNYALIKGPERVLNNREQMKFATYRFLWSQGLSKKDIIKRPLKGTDTAERKSYFLQGRLAGNSHSHWLLVDSAFSFPNQPDCQLRIDKIVIMKKTDIQSDQLADKVAADTVILGPEYPPWKQAGLVKKLQKSEIPCHTIAKDGALVENL